jgi:hypothetical protein
LIKEGLKVKVQQKLRTDTGASGYEGEFMGDIKQENQDLTPEDELRRKRRRDRNKIAATKCRNKKKAKTQKLVAEGEVVEVQNINLKQEIVRLEAEQRHLESILSMHERSCPRGLRRQRFDPSGHFRHPPTPYGTKHARKSAKPTVTEPDTVQDDKGGEAEAGLEVVYQRPQSGPEPAFYDSCVHVRPEGTGDLFSGTRNVGGNFPYPGSAGHMVQFNNMCLA